ncbi:hypothetical protein WA026_019597 [Henosepilachna vigintioctopunctata]|uniref:Endonuclease/exonuclease/phosphatase domain-containing protein n=1 Tax=Henosepilachna vigintioctopunctata TaxID=420089 RepID=A0AAW1TR56_9CUCU
MEKYDLFLMNDRSATRLTPPSQRKSAVDLTFGSRSLFTLSNWFVLEDTLGSDHFAIILDLHLGLIEEVSRNSLRLFNTKKADWQKFCDFMQNSTFLFSSGNNVWKYELFRDRMIMACNESIPLYSSKFVSKFNKNW